MKPEHVINQAPDIHGGKPVFTGTRVPIQSLIDHLKAGDGLDDFLEGFPSVSREQAITLVTAHRLESLLHRRQQNRRLG